MDYNYQQMARKAVEGLIGRYADPDAGNCYVTPFAVTFRSNDFKISIDEKRSMVEVGNRYQEVPNSWVVDSIALAMGREDPVEWLRDYASDMIARFGRARAALRRY